MKNKSLNLWWFYVILFFCIVIVVVIWWYTWYYPVTTVILVRHTEKATDEQQNLTDHGQNRADTLLYLTKDAGIDAIYATEFCRTGQTAQPLAQHLGLPINVQMTNNDNAVFENCDPVINVPVNIFSKAVNHSAELADRILTDHVGETVLVAGHSNTVPEIIEELGADPVLPISEDAYDNLYVVTVYRPGKATVVRLKYAAHLNK